MKVTDDKAVEKWVVKLAKVGIFVPEQVTMEMAGDLLKLTANNPKQRNVVAIFTLHLLTAQRCAQGEEEERLARLSRQQMNQNDQKSEQAA